MTKIFISYRRADSNTITGRIYDRLAHAFGKDNIFRDLDQIAIGDDFRGAIAEGVNQADYVLVIIGKQWLTEQNDLNQPRLFDRDDFVRFEVKSGLQRSNATVVPLLVDGATMPSAEDLPSDLRELSYRNARSIRNDPDFNNDVSRLIRGIKKREEKKTGSVEGSNTKEHSHRSYIFILAFFIPVIIIGGIIYTIVSSTLQPQPIATDTLTVTMTSSKAITDTPTAIITNTLTNTPTSTNTVPVQASKTNTPTIAPSDTPIIASPNEVTIDAICEEEEPYYAKFYLENAPAGQSYTWQVVQDGTRITDSWGNGTLTTDGSGYETLAWLQNANWITWGICVEGTGCATACESE